MSALEVGDVGEWDVSLLEFGNAEHPGEWVGPGFPEWMWTPMNGLLLRRTGQTILVDAGPGVLIHLWAFDGIDSDAPAALAAAGASADDVDLVVCTHLDDDHFGGVLDGTWPGSVRLAFPRARIVAHVDAIADVDARKGLPIGIEERIQALAILREAGVLDAVTAGEIAPDVRLREAPGHRAGHCCVEVGGNRPLVHIADTLHHPSHVEHPEWDGPADDDRALALETRRAVVGELADSGFRAVASHIAGVFTVARAEDGSFRIRPE
jgi:glyoxylase-like metal-dependent hydrolase (beta-lactamase superfamily II)